VVLEALAISHFKKNDYDYVLSHACPLNFQIIVSAGKAA
jgi:hypothetical protein